MRLDLALVADYAIAHDDGKLYVTGGGWSQIMVNELPYRHPTLTFVVRFVFEEEEKVRPHQIQIALIAPSGMATLGPAPLDWPEQLTPSRESMAVHALPWVHISFSAQQVEFKEEGRHDFIIRVDGHEVQSTPLFIRVIRP